MNAAGDRIFAGADRAAMRVDAHHHLWRLDRGDYSWLTPALTAIYRDYTVDDLRPLLEAAGVEATVLVQAAPTVAETEFLLAAARASNGLVRGVVGWADLASRDAVATLSRLAEDSLLKSVRPMLQDLPDPEWIIRADIRSVLGTLPQLGLRFDALVKPPQLPSLLRMVERNPDLEVVIDHGGKPAIAEQGWQPWARDMALLARNPNVHCKLSGLVTEAGPAWTLDTLRPYVEHLLRCFGSERLLWGSDWPVLELVGSYRRWIEASAALLAQLPGADRDAIFGGNARRFYRLDD